MIRRVQVPGRKCSEGFSLTPEYCSPPMIQTAKCSGLRVAAPEDSVPRRSPPSAREGVLGAARGGPRGLGSPKGSAGVLGVARGNPRALGSPKGLTEVLGRECSGLHVAAPKDSVPEGPHEVLGRECSGLHAPAPEDSVPRRSHRSARERVLGAARGSPRGLGAPKVRARSSKSSKGPVVKVSSSQRPDAAFNRRAWSDILTS